MHCPAVLAFEVRKGTGFLNASDLPPSDDEDFSATSCCSVIEEWDMILDPEIDFFDVYSLPLPILFGMIMMCFECFCPLLFVHYLFQQFGVVLCV